MVTSIPEPTRQELRQRLLDLLTGDVTREEVASWAGQWVREDSPAVDDPSIWEGLTKLAGADLMVSPDEYLHFETDFHSWLDALAGDTACGSGQAE